MARKPLSEKTVAENVLKWGTGGINIDACRIEHNEPEKLTNRTPRTEDNIFSDDSCGFKKETNHIASASPLGRFPANIILDEEAGQMLDEQNGDLKNGASRFFYCAKTSKSERGDGNNHPTVKPLKLIEYLVTLVTPTNGIVLDPFSGSATTALACINKNKNYICFEKDTSYFNLSEMRINNYKKKGF